MAADTRFTAMGTDVHVVVVGADALVDDARRRIDDLEQRWSRFLPTSEVSALNRAAGRAVAVSGETRLLVARAIEAWRATNGVFDPTVLHALVGAGYDVPFCEIGTAVAPPAREPADRVTRRGHPEAIVVTDSSVALPAGTGFDPGGIGKGLAPDLVVAELLARGAAGACVNMGGDLRVAGDAPDGGPWTIAIEHPERAEPLAILDLADGAVATSTTLRRRWQQDGRARHHLIDPATGEPSTTRVPFATVVSAQAWAAEIWAKVLVLRDDPSFAAIARTGAEALLVDADGNVRATFGFDAFARPGSRRNSISHAATGGPTR